MSVLKVKDAAKIFVSDEGKIQSTVIKTLDHISKMVGRTLGPSGRVIGIESDYPGIPNKMTKDGVTVFNNLAFNDPFEQFILEQVRAAAGRTASEAGDGTTTATILAAALTRNLLNFCNENPKYSPQRVARIMNKLVKEELLPAIRKVSIPVDADNLEMLGLVAKVSVNGDEEMAAAVIKAFEAVGYGEDSHVTIQEASGPSGYSIDLIEGYPINIGYEESIGKFHAMFITDQANLRCVVDKPVFILFDGVVTDLLAFGSIFEQLGAAYQSGKSDTCNVVFIAHGFSEQVIYTFAKSVQEPTAMNVIPVVTPMTAVINSRLNFLYDVSAFTGAKVFGLSENVRDWQPEDLGASIEQNGEDVKVIGRMNRFEMYRFRATIVGKPDEMDIETRAEVLRQQLQKPESIQAEIDLKERLGKLTTGIAKITIFADSSGEIREKHDRVEDAVCAVRAAISEGAVPGGCRVLTNLAAKMLKLKGTKQEKEVAASVLVPSLLAPLEKLITNGGISKEETKEIMQHLLFKDNKVIYDMENEKYVKPEDVGVYDATKAVTEALRNSVSVASTMGVLGGIIAYPRDMQLEREEASRAADYQSSVENPHAHANEANERI